MMLDHPTTCRARLQRVLIVTRETIALTGARVPPVASDRITACACARPRAKLDAIYFILCGIYYPADAERSRDDIRYIHSTFPIVERQERDRWGTYRRRDLALAWINALMAGQPDAEVAG